MQNVKISLVDQISKATNAKMEIGRRWFIKSATKKQKWPFLSIVANASKWIYFMNLGSYHQNYRFSILFIMRQ